MNDIIKSKMFEKQVIYKSFLKKSKIPDEYMKLQNASTDLSKHILALSASLEIMFLRV